MKTKKTTVADLPQSISLPLFAPVCSAIGLNPGEMIRCDKATEAGNDWGERQSRTWTVQETEWAALVEVAGLLQRIVCRFGRDVATETFRAEFFSSALEAWEKGRNPLAPFERYFATGPAIKVGFAAWNEAALRRESASAPPAAPAPQTSVADGAFEVKQPDAAGAFGVNVRTIRRWEKGESEKTRPVGYSRETRRNAATFWIFAEDWKRNKTLQERRVKLAREDAAGMTIHKGRA